jgi:hypothetical protein
LNNNRKDNIYDEYYKKLIALDSRIRLPEAGRRMRKDNEEED